MARKFRDAAGKLIRNAAGLLNQCCCDACEILAADAPANVTVSFTTTAKTTCILNDFGNYTKFDSASLGSYTFGGSLADDNCLYSLLGTVGGPGPTSGRYSDSSCTSLITGNIGVAINLQIRRRNCTDYASGSAPTCCFIRLNVVGAGNAVLFDTLVGSIHYKFSGSPFGRTIVIPNASSSAFIDTLGEATITL